MKAILFLSCCFLTIAYNQKKSIVINNNFIIKIQPFVGTDSTEIKVVADSIKNYYPNILIAPIVELPKFAFYPPRSRYKADSLLKYLSSIAQKNEVVLGITKSDISVKKSSIEDFGVMGYGRKPGNSCMASTFRLNMAKGKNQLFKVCIHELGHTMGLPHCANLQCYMRAANGGNPLNEEIEFCTNCKQYLTDKNWKF